MDELPQAKYLQIVKVCHESTVLLETSALDQRSGLMSVLVYDIGVNDGRDTSHYLREGYNVVSIDANPVICAAIETKFCDYIRIGQLQIINRGITEAKGQLEFWVCDDLPQWSSFHRDLASRHGAMHHQIVVDCVPIKEIIDEFGIADYMKIDIEGNEQICISGLTSDIAPKYISLEIEFQYGQQQLEILARLGYRGFKVICQNNGWSQVTRENTSFYERRPDHFIIRRLRRLRAVPRRLLGGRRYVESGPWGEKTSGAWHSVDHAQSVWRSLRDIDERQGMNGLGWWFDIHARK
jgi:FkbM family methyltransferase